MTDHPVSDKIDEIVSRYAEMKARNLRGYCNASDVESPIEQMFCYAISAQIFLRNGSWRRFSDRMGSRIAFDSAVAHIDTERVGSIHVWSQVTLEAYRFDFLVAFKGATGTWFVAVECDGHEFHERTANQASRDKSRDRDLQTRGIMAFRFTGREIWADAWGCAVSVIESLFQREFDAAMKRGAD